MNYRKAPKLINKKPRWEKNFYQMKDDVAELAFTELGYPAFRLLLVLMGTADNFTISTAWVCKKASIGTNNYSRARDELVKKGYILYTTNCDSITIDYESISKKVEIYLQGENNNPQVEDNSIANNTHVELNFPQSELNIPQGEKNYTQGEGYNKETKKTKKTNVVVDEFEGDFQSKINIFCVQHGKEAFDAVKRLRAGGRSNEWIYKALTTPNVNWGKGYGLLFGKSDACVRFRKAIDAKIVEPVEYVAPAATQPAPIVLTIPVVVNSSSPREYNQILTELDDLFSE